MILNALLIALRAIRRNLLRSFLTVLGVVIGVAAVITMVTLGKSATKQVANQISGLGSNLLMLRPGQSFGPAMSGGGLQLFRLNDVEAIRTQINQVQAVAPQINRRQILVYGNKNWQTPIIGSNQEYLLVGNWQLIEGRNFTQEEVLSGASVCIIGQTTRKELFGESSPVGEELRVGKFNCQIIGLLKAKGQGAMGNDQDDTVIIPALTMQRRITGNDNVSIILISQVDGANTEAVIADIRLLLRERRKVADGEEDGFSVIDTKQIAQTMSSSIKTLTGLLGAVAAVSLLVGGIGIMNIMLVSVTERTREIGVRLAIGALEREVLWQFLIEAVVLSALGGIAGIIFATLLVYLISMFLGLEFIFNPGINILSLTIAALIGVVFGFLPAKRAAGLDPIVALRYE